MSEPHQDTRGEAERLLDGQRAMLEGYLRHLVGSPHDADDLLQDVCVAVLEKPDLLLRGSDPGAYLRGIARHLASRHQRRIRRDPVLESVMEAAWEEPVEPAAWERERLRACLAQLSEKFRRLLAWRYVELSNAAEIAQRLESTPEAVRMALARTRAALGKCLRGRLAAQEAR